MQEQALGAGDLGDLGKDEQEELGIPLHFAHQPLEAVRLGFAERNPVRLTISAARTNLVLVIPRTVRPSGIPAATVF
jgi:hypothetical protein